MKFCKHAQLYGYIKPLLNVFRNNVTDEEFTNGYISIGKLHYILN